MGYHINERTLKKWAHEHLSVEPAKNGVVSFAFKYEGSTCSSGGIEIDSRIVIVLEKDKDNYIIKDANIEVCFEDDGMQRTCSFQEKGPEFLRKNISVTKIVGQNLEDVLQSDESCNPAGCFCSPANVMHKWYIALNTIDYYLHKRQ